MKESGDMAFTRHIIQVGRPDEYEERGRMLSRQAGDNWQWRAEGQAGIHDSQWLKTVTIRQVQHDFSAVLALVAQGDEPQQVAPWHERRSKVSTDCVYGLKNRYNQKALNRCGLRL